MKFRLFPRLLLACAALLPLSCSSSDSDPEPTFQIPNTTTAQVLAATTDRSAPEIVWGNQLLHAVWTEKRDTSPTATSDIWYGSAPIGGDFTATAQRITDTPEESAQPTIAVNSNGDVQLAWVEGSGDTRTIQSVFITGGTPGAASTISGVGNNSDPRMVFDSLNNLHMVWDQGDTIAFKQNAVAQITLPDGVSTNAAKPDITVNAANRVFVVWEAEEVISGITFRVLRIAASAVGTNPLSFGNDFGRLPVLPLTQGMNSPRIAAGDDPNELYCFYQIGSLSTNERRLRLSRFTPSGGDILLNHSRDVAITTTASFSALSLTRQVIGGKEEIYCGWTQQGDVWLRASLDGQGRVFGLFTEDFGTDAYLDGTVQGSKILVLGDKLVVAWSAQATAGSVRSIMTADVDISARLTTE